MVKFTAALAAAVLASSVVAHPGHSVAKEAAERRAFMESKPRSVGTCSASLKARGHTDKSIARRAAIAKDLHARKDFGGLTKRDAAEVLATSHKTNLTGLSLDTDETVLFSDDSSCVLQDDTTEGPYYVSGELIRSDVRNNESGVDTYVYLQVVDVSTCEPLENIYVDFWHCNSTGVYGGVTASGNGNSDDTSNLNNTMFRGIQATDSDGVVEFITQAPGHYTGRATHIHIMTHSPNDTQVYPNGTLGTNELLATHVGQIFFDQDLISEFEATAPYNTNTQNLTTNAEDSILLAEAATSDPVLEYYLLGDDITDGILAWVTVAIDTTNSIDVNNAAYYGEGGGVESGSFGSGGGAPSGSAPSGAAPTGTAPAARALRV